MNVDKNMQPRAVEDGKAWYSIGNENSNIQMTGFYWYSQDKIFRRIPKRYTISDNVNYLANNTAGGQLRFKTDSTSIAIRVKLVEPSNMYNMSALGQSGFDCYVALPNDRYYAELASSFNRGDDTYESPLFLNGESGVIKSVIINFPLYNGVESVEIGIDENAQIIKPDEFDIKQPIVFYGTSIAQGGCASRAGLGYTNIISRKLNANHINLGFSGSALGEIEMADVINEIKSPAALIIDIEANAGDGGYLEKNLEPLLNRIRNVHTDTPMLVVSRMPYRSEMHSEKLVEKRNGLREHQRGVVEKFKQKGDKNIHFLNGFDILGDDFDECYCDGVHPNDMGFMRMADKFVEVISKILKL